MLSGVPATGFRPDDRPIGTAAALTNSSPNGLLSNVPTYSPIFIVAYTSVSV